MFKALFLFISITCLSKASPAEYISAAQTYSQELKAAANTMEASTGEAKYLNANAGIIGRSAIFVEALWKHTQRKPDTAAANRQSTLESVIRAEDTVQHLRSWNRAAAIWTEGSKLVEAEAKLKGAIRVFRSDLEQGKYP